MHIPNLTPRLALSLANQNELSLALRLRQQKKTGRDPYNDLRSVVRQKNLMMLSVTATIAFIIFTLVVGPETFKYQNTSWFPATVAASWLTLCALAMVRSLATEEARLKSREFLRAFSKAVMYLNAPANCGPVVIYMDIVTAAEGIADKDLAELRELAKEKMVLEAEGVLEHQAAAENDRGAAWHTAHASLLSKFKEKYTIFQQFDLVWGSHDFFYAEARKRFAAQKGARLQEALCTGQAVATEAPFDVGACLDKAKELGTPV